uniref:Uncharacterized protein n=1 Tax=Solanum lycopersicum TaxID=4081 RepID=A0A3Q7I0Z7_SOLLC
MLQNPYPLPHQSYGCLDEAHLHIPIPYLCVLFLDARDYFFIKAIDSQGFKQIFELASLLKQIWLWQGLIKNVGSAARMTQEYKMAIDSSSKKRKVSYYKTPVDHQEYRSDEVLRHDDEEWKVQSVSMGEKSFLFADEEPEQEVAQKVDDHIPRLLNWQTTNESRRYKKLMNSIFSDVNNKYCNCHRRISKIKLHLKPSPQAVKVKRKGKVGSSMSPVRKRTKKPVTSGSKQDAKNLEPRIAVKQPMKKNVVSRKRTSGSEVEDWLKELSDFRKEVKQEFVEIRSLINDNFKTHSDDHIVPSNSNDEDGYTPQYTSNKESPSNQVLVVQCDKLESGNSEVDVEQMSCPVPIWVLDHMNVTTDSQFELDDQFMPSLNSIKSNTAPHSIVIKGHIEQLPTTIAGCITTKADQATIDVHLGTNGEKLKID